MLPRFALAAIACVFLTHSVAQEPASHDPESGLILDDHWELVRANCSGCHSVRLVTQNRMNATRWVQTIRWMQEKHNLWGLGENEPKIIAYLAKHYGVSELPHRRQPLNQPPIPEEDQTP